MSKLLFKRLIELESLPVEWEIVKLAVDWSGLPLLLMAEGKGRRPPSSADFETQRRWNWTPPTALHIVRFEGNDLKATRIDQGISAFALHVQPFEDGWIVGHGRGGRANLYSANGKLKRTLNLGDAIEDLQTLPNGQIWVSYFDEGVFGHNDLSREGLVCFDPSGVPIFRFGQYAGENHLPRIDDCYALNVAFNGDVWVNYYTAFPLLRFRDFCVADRWLEFGSVGKAFAVRNDGLLYLKQSFPDFSKATPLLKRIDAPSAPEPVDCIDDLGKILTPASNREVRSAARDAMFLLNTGSAIYGTAE